LECEDFVFVVLADVFAVLDCRQFFLEADAEIVEIRNSITNKENVRM